MLVPVLNLLSLLVPMLSLVPGTCLMTLRDAPVLVPQFYIYIFFFNHTYLPIFPHYTFLSLLP